MTTAAWRSTPTKRSSEGSSLRRSELVNRRSHHTGVTLPELLIVVTLIAVMGTFATPSLNSLESLRVTTATAQLTSALRYAREESIRTGQIHSVEFAPDINRVQVLLIPSFGSMSVTRPVVRHPISRQLYTLDLDDNPSTSPAQFDTLTLNFDNVGQQSRIDFMPSGQPVWIDIFDQPYRLLNGSIVLSAQASQQTITLDGLTGRVSSS